METHVSLYKGISTDISLDLQSPDTYTDAYGIRLITTNSESGYSVQNLKGNTLSFTLPNRDEEIIGVAVLRDTFILFTTNNNLPITNVGNGGEGWIYKLTYDFHTKVTTLTLLYTNPDLGFSKLYPIYAIGKYETPSKQRVYWTDYNMPIRGFNTVENVSSITNVKYFSLLNSPNNATTIAVSNIFSAGGSLLVGMYQGAYRLYTKDGKETLILSESRYIPITKDSHKLGNSSQYKGEIKDTVTSKAIEFTITDIETDLYSEAELIVVFRTSLDDNPEVFSVEKKTLSSSTVKFLFTNTELSQFTLTPDEFSLLLFPFYTSRCVNQKDGLLIAANTKSKGFEVPDELFCGLTKRFRRDLTSYCTDENDVNIYSNPYNNLSSNRDDLSALNHYKFLADGVRLGGVTPTEVITGVPHLQYTFHLEGFRGNDSYATKGTGLNNTIVDLGTGVQYVQDSYNNLASPYKAELLRGYKRGEVYRFCIVFYDKDLQPSFAKFIGDIKFPELYDRDSVVNNSGGTFFPVASLEGTNNESNYYSLGLNIELNLPPDLMSIISGFRIVRCKREKKDKTRVAQGTIQKLWMPNGFTPGEEVNVIPGGFVKLLNAGASNILYSGTVAAFYNKSTGGSPIVDFEWTQGTNCKNIVFYCPEISYRQEGLELQNSDSLRWIGCYRHEYYGSAVLLNNSTDASMSISRTSFAHTSNLDRLNAAIMPYQQTHPGIQVEIANSALLRGEVFDTVQIGTTYIKNYTLSPDAAGSINLVDIENQGFHATCLGAVIAHDYFDPLHVPIVDTSSFPYSPAPHSQSTVLAALDIPEQMYFMIDYIRYVAEQYGGRGEDALQSNTFIACSDFISTSIGIDLVTHTNFNFKVFGGDTYVTTYELLRSFYDGTTRPPFPSTTQNCQEIIYIPVETTLNLEYECGYNVENNAKFEYSSGSFSQQRLREQDNTIDNGVTRRYFYEYNKVFSQERDYRYYFIKPINIDIENITDYRAYYSDTKINGEDIDSWSKFRVNNFYDIDAQYGAITSLTNLHDEIYFTQERAFGQYLINPKAVVSTTTGPTELGSGLVFGDHGYLSTINGSIHQLGVIASREGIMFIDTINNELIKFTPSQGAQPISEALGIRSLLVESLTGSVRDRLEQSGDNPILRSGIISCYDAYNKETWFTILSSSQNTTLCYNNILGTITSRYPYHPSIYVYNKDIVLTPDYTDPENIYLHDSGDYGVFYNNTPESMMIEILINSQGDFNKILRFVEYNSAFFNGTTLVQDETLTSIRVYNDYQDSGIVPLTNGRVIRKFRKWRIKVPRDLNSRDGQGRFRGTFFKVQLYYDNLTNRRVVLGKILSYFDYQIF